MPRLLPGTSWRESSKRKQGQRAVRNKKSMSIKRSMNSLMRMNWVLFAAMVGLAIGSVFFIYSASYSGPGQAATHSGILPKYQMQIVWFAVGLILYVVTSFMDYRLICQWAAVWYTSAVGLLVL